MKDPAFLFYDGDAARDVSHMTRLERGCYFDFIQAQRKFHGITVEQARKILGKDFEECWPALELILQIDDEGKYFIEWIRFAEENRAQHAEKQRKRIQDYWDRKKKEEKNLKKEEKENDTTVIPRNKSGITTDIPYVNEIAIENENEDKIVSKDKGVQGEKERKEEIVIFEAEKPALVKKEIVMPFQSKEFALLWQNWKEYRKTEHKFSYKSPQSEQAALVELSNLSAGNEALATKTVLKSMQNGWKGFFKLKDDEKKEALTAGFNKLDYFLSKDGQIKRRRVLWNGEYILTREYCDHWAFLKDSEKTQQELDDMRDVMLQMTKRNKMYAELGENLERL